MEEKIFKCTGDCISCAMNCGNVKGKRTKKAFGIKIALIVFAGVVILSAILFTPAHAHIPGASPPSDFELKPIVVLDNGNETNITIDDVANYHGHLGPGVAMSFRQVQIGIKKLWGNEVPERDDIKIIARFKNKKAPIKVGMPMKGKYDAFIYILNNTENLEIVDCKGGVDCLKTTIIRKSTGEEFNISLREDVIPEGFFELKKKMMTKNITPEEMNELRTKWENFRNDLLTKSNYELFEYGTKKKDKFSIVNFSLAIVIAIVLFSTIYFIGKKIRWR